MRISSMPILMQSPSLSGKMPTSKPENTPLNCTNSQRDLAVAEGFEPSDGVSRHTLSRRAP